jgi:uncharacterized protein YcnI
MRFISMAALAVSSLVAVSADAHVEVTSGNAITNASNKITFAIAHGCTNAANQKLDTISVKIDIPAGVTSVRALTSDFGKATATFDASNNVTSITWTKPVADLQPADFQWYELTLRAHVPDAAFTKLQFVVTQVCQDAVGNQLTVVWDQPEGTTTGNPSPLVKIAPVHRVGWNKIVMAGMIMDTDLPAYFGDAQIVWRGNAAYSPSADVSALISATPGVTALSGAIMPGDELWVRY